MDVGEPRLRRRGFFLHSDTGEPDTGELENPEGFVVRVRLRRPSASRQVASVATRTSPSTPISSGRSRVETRPASADEDEPQIRSGSVTGSRQRAHWPR